MIDIHVISSDFMRPWLYVCPSIWGKDQQRDKNGKGTMGCYGGWFDGVIVRKKGRHKKHSFGRQRGTRSLFPRHSPGGATV